MKNNEIQKGGGFGQEGGQRQRGGFAPAFTLMVMAPLLTEVLPGATRFSSIFVFPVEVCVWGGGALLIRYALRRWRLGWVSMVMMALALALAEECLIQQTSLAPLVIRLKGVTYARAIGVNYVYMLWALVYEPVFVVVVSIGLVELIYPGRKERVWVGKAGLFVVIPLFVIGSFLAWFTWTQIARVKVFHLPAYRLPTPAVVISVLSIFLLVGMALRGGRWGNVKPLKPLSPLVLGVVGGVWAVLLYGLVLLAFGIDPAFSEWGAVGAGVVLAGSAVVVVPRFSGHAGWGPRHSYGLVCGLVVGSMAAGQLGFVGTAGPDLYFKIVTNIIAVLLLVLLGFRVYKRGETR
jgi:hypothetical protein